MCLAAQAICTNVGRICEAFSLSLSDGHCSLFGKLMLATTPGLPAGFTGYSKADAANSNTDATQTNGNPAYRCSVKRAQQPPGESAVATTTMRRTMCRAVAC